MFPPSQLLVDSGISPVVQLARYATASLPSGPLVNIWMSVKNFQIETSFAVPGAKKSPGGSFLVFTCTPIEDHDAWITACVV